MSPWRATACRVHVWYNAPLMRSRRYGVRLVSAGGTVDREEVRMAIRVKARSGESTDQMMKRFKKLCEREGLIKDIKRKEFYEKPSERRRRAARKSESRRLRPEAPIKA